jgi:hypothetical protein
MKRRRTLAVVWFVIRGRCFTCSVSLFTENMQFAVMYVLHITYRQHCFCMKAKIFIENLS